MSVELSANSDLDTIESRLTRELVRLIQGLCGSLQDDLNKILSEEGYPSMFILNFYPLTNFSGGRKKKKIV